MCRSYSGVSCELGVAGCCAGLWALMLLTAADVQGVARRVLVLTNKSQYPLLFNWDLGVMAVHGALQGSLNITPSTGRLLG